MGESYSTLGNFFEYLNSDCDYEKWSQYLIERLRAFNAGSTGIDIGCGNGYFTRALIKSGYIVSGFDVSAPMLQKAKELAAKEGVKAEFLLGDLTKLKLPCKVDFAVCINDCVNYISGEKLKNAFLKVYQNLKKGGVFIFDISSENKLKNVLGNNMFGEDKDEIAYLWFNSLSSDSVTMDLTFFVKNKNGGYDRFEERHVQYIHSEDKIVTLLKEIGFLVETEGHLGGDKSQRINFLCRKI